MTNNDPINRELSIEELEAIAAGGFFHWLRHEISRVEHYAAVAVRAVAPYVKDALKDLGQPWKHSPPGGL